MKAIENIQQLLNVVEEAAKSQDYCRTLVDQIIAEYAKMKDPWENHPLVYVSPKENPSEITDKLIPFKGKFKSNIYTAVSDADRNGPYNNFYREEQKESHKNYIAENIHNAAKRDLPMLQAANYLGVTDGYTTYAIINGGIRKVWNSVPDEKIQISKSGRRYHPDYPRITWKAGADFRTAAPYWFVWFDGQEIIHLWPEPGESMHWLDWLDK